MLSYPSPFTSQVNVSISSDRNQQVVAVVYDALGKMVRSETKRLYTGENNFTLTGLDNLDHGIYYAVIKDESGNLLGRTQLLKN